MISINAQTARENVLVYEADVLSLVYKACLEIEKAARSGEYSTLLYIGTDDYDKNESVISFLISELGYKVIQDCEMIKVYWHKHLILYKRNDEYLTALAAYDIAYEVTTSYENVTNDISEKILEVSQRGCRFLSYNCGNLSDAFVDEIVESLKDAGYDVTKTETCIKITW